MVVVWIFVAMGGFIIPSILLAIWFWWQSRKVATLLKEHIDDT